MSVTKPRWLASGSRLLFESALIILSVFAGFVASSWSERMREREMADRALVNFRREIAANLSVLERVQPKHAQFADRLAAAAAAAEHAEGQSAFDLFVKTMPEGGLDAPPLREAAWEAAVSTGALRLLDYDLAAQLSETYLVQRSTLMPTLKLLTERMLDNPTFDPGSRSTMLHVQHMLLRELAGQESYLMDLYRTTLDALPPTP